MKNKKKEIDEFINEYENSDLVRLLDPNRNKLNQHIIKLKENEIIKVEKKILEQFIKRILERRQRNRLSKYDNQILDISNSNMLNDNKEGEIQLDKCRRKLNKIIKKDNNNEETNKNNKKEITILNQKRARSKNKLSNNSKANNKKKTKNTRKNKITNKNKKTLEYIEINNNYDNNESLKSKIK